MFRIYLSGRWLGFLPESVDEKLHIQSYKFDQVSPAVTQVDTVDHVRCEVETIDADMPNLSSK